MGGMALGKSLPHLSPLLQLLPSGCVGGTSALPLQGLCMAGPPPAVPSLEVPQACYIWGSAPVVPRHAFPQSLSAHVAHAPPLPAHHVATRLCACQSPWPWKHPGGAGPLQEPTPDARPGLREEEGSAERSWAGSMGPGLPLPQHRPQSATRPWTRSAAPLSSTKWNWPSESVQGAESRVKQPSLEGGGLELPSLDWDGLEAPPWAWAPWRSWCLPWPHCHRPGLSSVPGLRPSPACC